MCICREKRKGMYSDIFDICQLEYTAMIDDVGRHRLAVLSTTEAGSFEGYVKKSLERVINTTHNYMRGYIYFRERVSFNQSTVADPVD